MSARLTEETMPTTKPQWHGDGIFSKVRARDGKTVYYAQYWYKGKRVTEKGGTTLLQAQKLRLRRLEEIDNRKFVHPGEVKQQAREQISEQKAIAAARVDLVFENSVKRFLDRCGKEYSDPKALRSAFGRLGRAFCGRRLDDLTRRDVLQYESDRLGNTGPFAGQERRVGMRTPQSELTLLSALFSFLIVDEEREDLVNPCRSAGGRRRRGKATVYRPARKPVIADRAGRLALFRAASGDPEMRAFLKLTYYTAARPESEACTILHGDVELPDPGKVRSLDGSAIVGHVTYRDTKTGQDRCVPLHPKAVRALRRIMLPRPACGAALEAWEKTPVFRRQRSKAAGTPWDCSSYRKAWREIRAIATRTWTEVSRSDPGYQAARLRRSHHARGYRVQGERVFQETGEQFLELRKMIVRDLRKTANTEMRSKGTDRATAARILGHSSEMNYRYVEATDDAAQRAIMGL